MNLQFLAPTRALGEAILSKHKRKLKWELKQELKRELKRSLASIRLEEEESEPCTLLRLRSCFLIQIYYVYYPKL